MPSFSSSARRYVSRHVPTPLSCSTSTILVLIFQVGPYYASGFKPVQLLATTKFVRAAPGGTGGYKLGAKWVSSCLVVLCRLWDIAG